MANFAKKTIGLAGKATGTALGIAGGVVGGVLGGPAGAAAGGALGKMAGGAIAKATNPQADAGSGMTVPSRASSIEEARGQDKARMKKSYGM